MRHILRLIFLSITIVLLFGCSASRIYKPKRLDVFGDYKNSKSGIVFPENFEKYKREKITSFNKDSSNVGVSYFLDNSRQDPYFTIYIYPAPTAIEHRIRNEYFDCLQSIANLTNKGIDVSQEPVKLSKDGYKLIGLSAAISQENLKTVLVLFECGKYFMKYRITSNSVDTSVLIDISKKLMDKFSPIDVLKMHPLSIWSTIHIAPGVTKDTSTLKAILVAAGTKNKWVFENIDSLERCSGFPSLYFEEQRITISEMLKKWESINHNNTPLDKYFNDLLYIRNSGYLNEFIYDQYNGILLLPEGLKLDFDGYDKWKRINNPTVKLTGQYYYLIGFEKSNKDEK